MKHREITIDMSTVTETVNTSFDGLGVISANNSSRLLMDYKYEKPEIYYKILDYLFNEKYTGITLLKLELGADVNSSSGTEPSVKRYFDEKTNIYRGAGFMLAADAKKINPNLKLDMLYWGVPAWVNSSADKNHAMYLWYKETIDALYDTYGIKVDYVTASQNEKALDCEWIKYLHAALRSEKNSRYDYSKIQIVAGEGVTNWDIADRMLEDSDLMNSVDVISSHYTSFTSPSAKLLQEKYGKKVWFSEGSSPMKVAELATNKENGIGGINGLLDIATRLTQAFTECMTMYEFQPAIAGYYDGASYYPKQLITANKPWSGAFSIDAGFYMLLHFGAYIKKGFKRIRSGCFGDGVCGGDGHAITASTYNYVSYVAPDYSEYTGIFVNNTAEPITYNVDISELPCKSKPIFLVHTKDGSYLKKDRVIIREADGSKYSYTLTLEAFSMATVSTLNVDFPKYQAEATDELLSLPYQDDFSYDKDYIIKRGGAPRYTTDEGGAFEVSAEAANSLQQIIDNHLRAVEWGASPEPVTTLGDDRWHNYKASVTVDLAKEKTSDDTNYVGIGIRYILADAGQSGYWVKLTEHGDIYIMKNSSVLCKAAVDNFDYSISHKLGISAEENIIMAYLDERCCITFEDNEPIINSGRAALYSAYEKNSYKNLIIEPLSSAPYISRYDDMAAEIHYSEGSTIPVDEGWYFSVSGSFRDFNRTTSVGNAGAYMSFDFTGNEFALICSECEGVVDIEIDGCTEDCLYKCTDVRTSPYQKKFPDSEPHHVRLTVREGIFTLDAIEVSGIIH